MTAAIWPPVSSLGAPSAASPQEGGHAEVQALWSFFPGPDSKKASRDIDSSLSLDTRDPAAFSRQLDRLRLRCDRDGQPITARIQVNEDTPAHWMTAVIFKDRQNRVQCRLMDPSPRNGVGRQGMEPIRRLLYEAGFDKRTAFFHHLPQNDFDSHSLCVEFVNALNSYKDSDVAGFITGWGQTALAPRVVAKTDTRHADGFFY